jgi:cytochrome c553
MLRLCMKATIVAKRDQQLRDLAAWFASQRGLGGGAAAAAGVSAAGTASGAVSRFAMIAAV